MPAALLLDVGEVLFESNWLRLDAFSAAVDRTVVGRGPLDPEGDPLWQRHLAGELTMDGYWDAMAAENGFGDRLSMWRALAVELGGSMFAADTLRLVADAEAAGIPVGVLSNDLVASLGREWVESRPELDVDVLVDASELGVRKPEPEPYLEAATRFGLPPGEIVFLDDTPECVAGAEAVGMVAVLVDPLDRAPALARARELLGLARRGEAA